MKLIDEKAPCHDCTLIDSVYGLVGLTPLFRADERGRALESILRSYDVQFFENTAILSEYLQSMAQPPTGVIFVNDEFEITDKDLLSKLNIHVANEMHLNDLIFRLLREMEIGKLAGPSSNEIHDRVIDAYRGESE